MKPCEQAARRRQRLLWRIHRRYVTTASEVRLGDFHFLFTRIADPDRVLDEVAEEADRRERLTGHRQPDEQLHLPYWAELWDSAMGIGQFLVRSASENKIGTGAIFDPHARQGAAHGWEQKIAPVPIFGPVSSSPRPALSPSLRVLDLGCGMGLSGTIAAGLGARVLFADIEPPALLFAQLNSLPWSGRVRTRRVDWRSDRLGETFDLILGADILYERTQWQFLEPFWRRHLSPEGEILLGEPGRQTGDLFIDWIRNRGWQLDMHEEKVPTRERPIRIFRLRPQP
ncbi:MAG TPA: class I SAM-dependent methyltransferase [Tepidisphaeraceae bacterium]|nr:class I SAM-dependent methyltransferase [Tepidisphaeraceae bacterium]